MAWCEKAAAAEKRAGEPRSGWSGLQKGRNNGEICEEHGGASKEHRVNKKARVIRGSSSGMQLGMPTPTSTPRGWFIPLAVW